VRTVRLVTSDNHDFAPHSVRKFVKATKSRNFRRNLKYLGLIEAQPFLDKSLHKVLYACRHSRRINLRVHHFWLEIEQRLNFDVLSTLYYILNKRNRKLAVENHDNIKMNTKYIPKIFQVIKQRPVKEFCFTQQMGFSAYYLAHYNEIQQLFTRIVETIGKMKWLEGIKLTPSPETCGYEKALNKMRNLKEVVISECFAREYDWIQPLYNSPETNPSLSFFNNFVNIANLRKLSLEVENPSLVLIERVLTTAMHLKFLSLSFIGYDKLHKTIFLPPQFYNIWPKIKNLKELESLELIHPSPVEESLTFRYLSMEPTATLTNLKRFTNVINSKAKNGLVNLISLGEAIEKWNKLEYLKIHTFLSNDVLEGFLNASVNCVNNLKEIDFEFQKTNEILIGEEIVRWFQSKEKLRYVQLKFGREMGYISADTLRNVCKGLLTLKKLHSLKLCFRSMHDTSQSIESMVRRIMSKEDKCIISDMITGLTDLKRLTLHLGTGYLEDQELKRIMKSLLSLKSLRALGLGGNFEFISSRTMERMIDFVKQSIKEVRYDKVVILAEEYKGNYLRELMELVEKSYGDKPKKPFEHGIKELFEQCFQNSCGKENKSKALEDMDI